MVRQRVKRGAHAQTSRRAAKEAREDSHVGGLGGLVPRVHHLVNISCRGEGDDGAEEVRPDVDGLVVQVEEGAEGVRVGGAGLAVAGADVVVVAAPGGRSSQRRRAVESLVRDGRRRDVDSESDEVAEGRRRRRLVSRLGMAMNDGDARSK